ncbi:MAG TPA: diguanylate cyclase [Longimicrobium sp.]|nr:diguanylate cyclase [Longimicrobium sp.]
MAGTPIDISRQQPDEQARAAVDALNQRAWELRRTDAAEGVRVAEQARDAARAAGYAHGEAHALRNAGCCRYLILQHEEALADLNSAERLFDGLGDGVGKAGALNWIGSVHWRRAEYPAALQAQVSALALQREAGDRVGEGDSLIHLGNVYYHLSDFPRALEHYGAALVLKEEQGDLLGLSHALNNIGNIHGRLGRYAEALEHHRRALALKRQLEDRVGEGVALVNLGSSYEALHDYPRALGLYQEALRHSLVTGHLLTRADVLRDLGDVHRKLGDLPAALGFYQQAVDVAVTAETAYLEAEARIGLGRALVESGDASGMNELRAALALAKRIESPRIAYEAHLALSEAYEAAGDMAAALEHFRAYHRVEDEVNGAEAERRIQGLLVQAEIERSQREAELLRARNDALSAANDEKARLLETLRAQAAELERLTREDGLTGVFNRRHLDAELALEWERARRFGRDLSAVMVDVDHFKDVNDRWSHATGDAVLREVARILREGTRAVDVVGRYGGEEFLLLLVETPPERAAGLCEKLRAAIEAHAWPSVPGLRVTASFGVAGNAATDSPDALVAAADARLYAAKGAGRNRVVSGDVPVE